MNCVYCENPLECDACGALFNPKGLGRIQGPLATRGPDFLFGMRLDSRLPLVQNAL